MYILYVYVGVHTLTNIEYVVTLSFDDNGSSGYKLILAQLVESCLALYKITKTFMWFTSILYIEHS